jgi:hypothetical protein
MEWRKRGPSVVFQAQDLEREIVRNFKKIACFVYDLLHRMLHVCYVV